MKTCNVKGSMTVFLSLISVLFIALICTSVESVRFQCARAEAAAALDMGNFSLFGEFENKLLEEYDVFALDGACGSGYYNTAGLEWKLMEYIRYNTSPNTGLLLKGFDPFQVQLDAAKITGVSLLTDENGEAFYQQAVGFMYDNFATEAIDIWLERRQQAETLQKAADDYQQQENRNTQNLSQLQQQQKEEEARIQEEKERQKKEALEQGLVWEEEPQEEKTKVKNPLETIKTIQRMGIVGIALGEGKTVSDKKLSLDIVSKRRRQKGTLQVKKKYSGIAADLLFQEYLFERFGHLCRKSTGTAMDYELEYILVGKNSDEKNLKSVLTRLLLLREGANFLYLCNSPQRAQEAETLAGLVGGAIPIPGLTVVISYALLLVWAYAESILDLRILANGGKVPIWKDDASWHMDLEDIPQILEYLTSHSGRTSDTGLSYEGYLQILFTLSFTKRYPIRALDLIEKRIKAMGNPGFRADQAIVKMETKAEYTIEPLFLRVTNAFLPVGSYTADYQATGTFAY